MGKKGQQWLAIGLIIVGGVLLAANYLPFTVDQIFWPMVLIVIGLLMVFRPSALRPEAGVHYAFDGDVVAVYHERLGKTGALGIIHYGVEIHMRRHPGVTTVHMPFGHRQFERHQRIQFLCSAHDAGNGMLDSGITSHQDKNLVPHPAE